MTSVVVSPGWIYTVIYDGRCEVCGRIVSLVVGWDREGCLEVFPSQTPGIREEFPQIPAADFDASLQVVGRDGRVWQGAEACARVMSVLPCGSLPAALLGFELLRPLAERAYSAFARNRFRFGCTAHCGVRSRHRKAGRPSRPL